MQTIIHSGMGGSGSELMGDILLWLIFVLAPLVLVAYLVFRAFSAPLRRQERARLFIDLLEAGFRQGQRPENFLVQAAQSAEPSLGPRFRRLTARLQEGLRLSQALERVPRLLPAEITAMLKVGEEIGDVRKVLPACRKVLGDAQSQTRSGFNYLVLTNMVLLPIMPVIILILNVVVFPKFRELAAGTLYTGVAPPMTLLAMRMGFRVAMVQLAVALFLYGWVLLYARGPRHYGAGRRPLFRTPLGEFVGRPFVPVRDWILYALPWRRKRMQRDFCAMLSLLLDADTPEPKAIGLAAESTANLVFVQRARRAVEDLGGGKPLKETLGRFDSAGEFGWRLANAARSQGGLLPALSGWIEALEAKAFQQEQTASQLITTALVLCNGLVVGLMAVGVFSLLISITEGALLW
ncbi:MAG: type II secretion system F family protein [Verrucomicrobiota bacterium]|jgi:type II secretory pathway component PulF